MEKTYSSISKIFFWPNMKQDIEQYIKTCPACQRNGSNNQNPAGPLVPLEVPTGRWTDISMDFVTGLPASEGFDSIMVVCDRLSKRVRFIANKTTDTVKEVVQLFVDRIATQFGFPNNIVSDRDSKFTSKFWDEFVKLCHIDLRMSSAMRPQTDGQTERVNRILEEMLRTFTRFNENNWTKLLPMLEFAVNSSYQSTIKKTPFKVDLGRVPHNPLVYTEFGKLLPKNKETEDFVAQLNYILETTRDLIRQAQDNQKKYHDKYARVVNFREGGRVLVNSNHLTVEAYRDYARKLQPKWVGPFIVKKKVSAVSYELELGTKIRAHPVFHVSSLKEYFELPDGDPRREDAPIEIVDGVVENEIESILRSRKKRNRTEYLVKWKGFEHDDNEWLPESELKNSAEILKDFKNSLKSNKRSSNV